MSEKGARRGLRGGASVAGPGSNPHGAWGGTERGRVCVLSRGHVGVGFLRSVVLLGTERETKEVPRVWGDAVQTQLSSALSSSAGGGLSVVGNGSKATPGAPCLLSAPGQQASSRAAPVWVCCSAGTRVVLATRRVLSHRDSHMGCFLCLLCVDLCCVTELAVPDTAVTGKAIHCASLARAPRVSLLRGHPEVGATLTGRVEGTHVRFVSIQACRDFLVLAQTHSKKWQKSLQYERDQRIRLEETLEQLAKQHNHLERAFRGATVLPACAPGAGPGKGGGTGELGGASDRPAALAPAKVGGSGWGASDRPAAQALAEGGGGGGGGCPTGQGASRGGQSSPWSQESVPHTSWDSALRVSCCPCFRVCGSCLEGLPARFQ